MERAAYGCYSVVCLEEHVFYTRQAAADPVRSSRRAHPTCAYISRGERPRTRSSVPVLTVQYLSIAHVLYGDTGPSYCGPMSHARSQTSEPA